MKYFKHGLMALLSVLAFSSANAAEHRIATTLPIAQALSEALLSGTDIESVYLPPKRLPVKRVASWLKSKSTERIRKAGPFDALVTVESVWSRYAVYGKLRTENIRVVPIDIAHELNEPGSRVSRSADPAHQRHYFWLSPDNLLVMSQILARDIGNLWPEQKAKINSNLHTLRLNIQSYSAKVDQVLLDNDVLGFCLQAPELMPLAQALFLPLEEEGACDPDQLRLGKKTKKAHAEPLLWLVDSAEKPLKSDLKGWLDGNYERLQAAVEMPE